MSVKPVEAQIGSDEGRRMILLRCPRCGALYENTARGADRTHRLREDEAHRLFAAFETDETDETDET